MATKKPYGDVKYADPKNGKYPIDTEAHVRAAWSYINVQKNADEYPLNGVTLSEVKNRIRAAAKKFGITLSEGLKDEEGVNLIESAADVTNTGKEWNIQIISEGVGSKGIYPADVLERDGAATWPSGTQIFMDHLTENDVYERGGQHSIRDLVGVTTTDAMYNPDTRALDARARWFNGFESFVEDAKDHLELSIEAHGLQNEDGIVLSLLPSPLNAIAVVPRGGRDGKILSLVESYREKHGIIINDTNGRKDKAVTPEEIKALVEGIVEGLKPSFTALTEALKPAPAADEHEDDAPDIAAISEALAESSLPKVARTAVYEALSNGVKLEDAISAQKAFITELTESLKSDMTGTLKTAKTETTDTFGVSGWGN